MKAIFFDLDGTLLHFTKEYDNVLKEAFLQTCGECSQKWITSYSNNFFDYFERFEPNPYRKSFEDLHLEYQSEEFVRKLGKAELEMCELPTDCKIVLEELAKNYELGVLTNGVSDWQQNKLREFDLLQYFDSIVVSYDVGVHKPEQGVFKFAEETVSATEFEMIGDSQEDDITGAKAVGWNTQLYQQQGFDTLFKT